MSLKKKYQLLLLSVIVSVPLLLLIANFLMMGVYTVIYGNDRGKVPFHESFAYPAMLIVFFLSLILLIFLFSKSIHSLLDKINLLKKTIRDLASDEKIPSKLEIQSKDEIGELINSVNLLIERTTYRELEQRQQEEFQKELLNKLRHDINTPLTAIRLQFFYLEDELKNQAPMLESLNQQIQYIAELTDEVNFQSTDSLNDSYLVQENINMSDLLETMVRKWGYLYSLQQIDLIYTPLDKNLAWKSNHLWLQRLFDNIFQNTLRHSKANRLEIIISNKEISFIDNGTGFDTNSQKNGLGLKIIKDLATIMNINYTLQSSSSGTVWCFKVE